MRYKGSNGDNAIRREAEECAAYEEARADRRYHDPAGRPDPLLVELFARPQRITPMTPNPLAIRASRGSR